MPIKDGNEATQRIRKNRDKQINTLPVKALTANALKGDRDKCIEAGMDDYLAKPIRPNQLEELLKKWL